MPYTFVLGSREVAHDRAFTASFKYSNFMITDTKKPPEIVYFRRLFYYVAILSYSTINFICCWAPSVLMIAEYKPVANDSIAIGYWCLPAFKPV